ncbi:MAG: ester cyclase [Candidatus Dormibacteria bacterium]
MADIERGKETVRRVIFDGIAQGRTDVVDECLAPNAVDDHHPEVGDYRTHLKEVARGLHTAFPDLKPEITHLVGEGDTIAFRVILRGTHDGPLQMPGMPQPLPATGRQVQLEQFHIITVDDTGRGVNHWAAVGDDDLRRQLAPAQRGAA